MFLAPLLSSAAPASQQPGAPLEHVFGCSSTGTRTPTIGHMILNPNAGFHNAPQVVAQEVNSSRHVCFESRPGTDRHRCCYIRCYIPLAWTLAAAECVLAPPLASSGVRLRSWLPEAAHAVLPRLPLQPH